MKKRYTVWLFTFVFACTLLCACKESTSQKTETTKPPIKCKEISIKELISEDGKSVDSNGIEYDYSYHVPQIEEDTKGAAQINEEIAAVYGELAKTSFENVQMKEIPERNIVTYESYRSGDILSFVIKCTHYYEYLEEYDTYSYDVEKGMRLANEDLLKKMDVTEEEYLETARRAAVKCYDDEYHASWEESGFDILSGDYQERRSWTISEKNITSYLPIYIDQKGALHTITPIGCHTGADWVYKDLMLDLMDPSGDVETEDSLDFLTVTRKGRDVTLRFNKTPACDEMFYEDSYMGSEEVPYGKEFPVMGLYGDYTQMFCGIAGECDMPYVFLITKEGRVDYIDVMSGLNYGYFCASGSLLGVEDVKSLYAETDENKIRQVYAVTGKGENIALYDLIVADKMCTGSSRIGQWGTTFTMDDGQEEFVSLTLNEGNGDNINLEFHRSEQDEIIKSDGYMSYLGMTEKGSVFTYGLWKENGDKHYVEGVIILNIVNDYTNDTCPTTLEVTELRGTPLLAAESGETTSLVPTFG